VCECLILCDLRDPNNDAAWASGGLMRKKKKERKKEREKDWMD